MSELKLPSGENSLAMKKPLMIIGGLLALLVLALAVLYFARPSLETELLFETISGRSEPRSYDGGLLPYGIYEGSTPALFVITSPEEVDNLAPILFTNGPELADRLSQLDYQDQFILMALHGPGDSDSEFSVARLTRRGNRVSVWAKFTESPAVLIPGTSILYHIVSISKEGVRGRPLSFVLIERYQQIAETTRFIPS